VRWFVHPLRVRYQETDQMGVVYHINYVNWFEIGRTELIRQMGYPYRRIEELGLLLPVLEAEAKFRQPARYDDVVHIYTKIEQFTSLRLDFSYEIRRQDPSIAETIRFQAEAGPANAGEVTPQGELLATGMTRHVWVNRSWKPVRLEKEAPELYELLASINRFTNS
jgi:acyl-CoA thioester hydrolase